MIILVIIRPNFVVERVRGKGNLAKRKINHAKRKQEWSPEKYLIKSKKEPTRDYPVTQSHT